MRYISLVAALSAAFAGPALALSSDRAVMDAAAMLPKGPALLVFADPTAKGFMELADQALGFRGMYETRSLIVIVADPAMQPEFAARFDVSGPGPAVVAFVDGKEVGRLAGSDQVTATNVAELVDRAIPDVYND